MIFCSKILLNVLHNTSLKVSLPWQHTGFQTSLILRLFWPPVAFYLVFANGASYACPASIWICQLESMTSFNFFWGENLQQTEIELPWEQNAYKGFSGLCCKLAEIALFLFIRTKSMRAVIGQSAVVYCAVNLKEKSRVFWIII